MVLDGQDEQWIQGSNPLARTCTDITYECSAVCNTVGVVDSHQTHVKNQVIGAVALGKTNT